MKLGSDTVKATGVEGVLGIMVTDRLGSWRDQVEAIVKLSGEKLNALKLGCKEFNFKKSLEISKSIYLAKFFYGVEVWGPGHTKFQIKTLQGQVRFPHSRPRRQPHHAQPLP